MSEKTKTKKTDSELNTIFCSECRTITEYTFRTATIKKEICGKEYDFQITQAICENCGNEINVPGLSDSNSVAIDKQYRLFEDIISTKDIDGLVEKYRSSSPRLSRVIEIVSLALGFEKDQLERYLKGEMPSKKSSDIIKKAIANPEAFDARMTEIYKCSIDTQGIEKIKLEGDYWIDENGNKWKKGLGISIDGSGIPNFHVETKEDAFHASQSLKNCYDCTDCYNCTDCRNCDYCQDCVNCDDCFMCRKCTNCSDCKNCFECFACMECLVCKKCNNCLNCSGCEESKNCRSCKDCRKCQDCTDCYLSFGIIGITEVSGAGIISEKVYDARSFIKEIFEGFREIHENNKKVRILREEKSID